MTAERWAFRFRPPGLAVSENAVRGRHWAAIRDRLEPWRTAAEVAARAAKAEGAVPVGIPLRVRVTIPVAPMARRRDPHNYVGTVVKSVVDGMVAAGIWPDDNERWVEVLEPRLDPGGAVVRVVLLPRGSVRAEA